MTKNEKAPTSELGLDEERAPVSPVESNPESAPAAPKDELTVLREKASEYEDDLKRLQAEFQNYQNRAVKEKAQARLDGQAAVLRQFLSFQDEMESALSHIRGASEKGKSANPATAGGLSPTVPNASPASPDASSAELRKGVELLHLKLVGIFASAGVKEIGGHGPVDPHKYEVLVQEPGGKEGHIAHVLRKGYVLGEHVLRVAQVSVYSGQKPDETKSEE